MKKKILVVDDDKSILNVFTKILQKAGYKVDTAESAAEGTKRIRRKDYDVVLIDIKLPDGEGTDLLLKLPKTSDMARIIITGFSTAEHGEQAAKYGADDYLVKPVKAEELLETVKRLTEKT